MQSIKIKRDVIVLQTEYEKVHNRYTVLKTDLNKLKSYYSFKLGEGYSDNMNTNGYMCRWSPDFYLNSSSFEKVAILPKELF